MSEVCDSFVRNLRRTQFSPVVNMDEIIRSILQDLELGGITYQSAIRNPRLARKQAVSCLRFICPTILTPIPAHQTKYRRRCVRVVRRSQMSCMPYYGIRKTRLQSRTSWFPCQSAGLSTLMHGRSEWDDELTSLESTRCPNAESVSSTASSPTENTDASAPMPASHLSTGAIVGIAVASSVAGLSAIALFIFLCIRKRRSTGSSLNENESPIAEIRPFISSRVYFRFLAWWACLSY